MPYQESEDIITPTDETIIWRYMDLTKLLSILEDNTLFFTRADGFEDDFEGSLPKKNFEEREIQRVLERRHAKPWDFSDSEYIKNLNRYVGISCWHNNPVESAAMWKLYLSSGDGIAIKSTVKRLKDCISDNHEVFIGQVDYNDYDKEKIDFSNYFSLYLNKRKSFIHEQEIRAIIFLPPTPIFQPGLSSTHDYKTENIVGGIPINIKPSILIEEIRVSPKTPAWFLKLVKNIVKKRYLLDIEVTNSEMDGPPLR